VVIFGVAFLPTEKRLIVPTVPTTAVNELLEQAVRRARSLLGLELDSAEGLELHTDSQDDPIAFGEDALADVLDPQNTMVWVGRSMVSFLICYSALGDR
jgi:hypothetical protein